MTSAIELRDFAAPAAPGAKAAAVRGLSLRIEPGEQVALIGPSGAGKSTLLMGLACAVQPLAGSLALWGSDPWKLGSSERQRLRHRLFLAPQVPPLPPRQRVVTAVLAGRLPAMSLLQSLATLWHPKQAGLAEAALGAFDLADKLWHRVDRLSGGERQRVGLARALVSQAALWLVDEPLSALDPTRAAQAIGTLIDSARREQRTLVCSLHQVEVARERFPRIVALRNGGCVYDGPSAGLSDDAVDALYADEPTAASPAEPHAPAVGALPESMCR
ncbi:phosphonate ABC transporter ATP-binding protein [Sphaerotilaceae bacterium SBD11-9]